MYGTSSTKVTFLLIMTGMCFCLKCSMLSDEQKGKCKRIEQSINFTHVLKHINLIDVPLQFEFYLHVYTF
jgi:hypothetical protein